MMGILTAENGKFDFSTTTNETIHEIFMCNICVAISNIPINVKWVYYDWISLFIRCRWGEGSPLNREQQSFFSNYTTWRAARSVEHALH